MVERKPCKEAADCPFRQFCYDVSKTCVDYVFCNRYNRLEGEKLSRDPSHCGPCFKGYTAEILATSETAPYCTKIAAQTKDPASTMDTVSPIETWKIIVLIIIIITIVLSTVILIIPIKKRYFTKSKKKKRSEWTELQPVFHRENTAKASAPPEERNSNTLKKEFKKETYCLSYNNNSNAVDNNRLVATRPFMPPNWVSNVNFDSGDDSNDDDFDTPDQQNIISQLPAINNSDINNYSSEHVVLQMPEFTTEHQDNARNSVLMQTYLPSNDNSSNADSTSDRSTNENKNKRNGTRNGTSNVLINQNIIMNVNVVNGDEY